MGCEAHQTEYIPAQQRMYTMFRPLHLVRYSWGYIEKGTRRVSTGGHGEFVACGVIEVQCRTLDCWSDIYESLLDVILSSWLVSGTGNLSACTCCLIVCMSRFVTVRVGGLLGVD